MPRNQVQQVADRYLDTFWLTGRSRCVDYVCELVFGRIDHMRFIGAAIKLPRVIQVNYCPVAAEKVLSEISFSNQNAGLSIAHHEGQALGGISRVKRQVSAAGLQNRQRGHYGLR